MTVQSPNLRPLNAGEILDRTFRLYRANFSLFIGIAGVLLVPLGFLKVITEIFFHDIGMASILQAFLFNLVFGALTWAASRAYLGLGISANEAYRVGLRRFWSSFGVFFLYLLAFVVPILVLLPISNVLSILLALFWCVVYILYLLPRWSVVFPVMMIEGLDTRASLKRSWSLTANQHRHVLTTFLTSFLLVFLVASLPGAALHYSVRHYGLLPEIGLVISTIVTQLGVLISTPLSLSATVILYYDLRVRREAYDLELALEATEEESDIF